MGITAWGFCRLPHRYPLFALRTDRPAARAAVVGPDAAPAVSRIFVPTCSDRISLLLEFAAASRTLLLPLHRNRLQFEMPAPQERSRPDEFPRRQIFRREVALVNRIEFLE